MSTALDVFDRADRELWCPECGPTRHERCWLTARRCTECGEVTAWMHV